MENNQNNSNAEKAESALSALRRDYVIVGRWRLRRWYAWLLVGVVVGSVIGVMFVANRSGEFSSSFAAEGKRADLVVSKIEAILNHPGGLTATITVTNSGRKRSPAGTVTKVEVFPSGPDQSVSIYTLTDFKVPALNKGQTYAETVYLSESLPPLPPGAEYWIVNACADWTNLVREKKEKNNCKRTKVQSLSTEPRLHVLSPNGGEIWRLDTMQTIQWSIVVSNLPPPSGSTLEVSLINELPNTPPVILTRLPETKRSYSFNLASNMVGPGKYRARVTRFGGGMSGGMSDESDGTFSIITSP